MANKKRSRRKNRKAQAARPPSAENGDLLAFRKGDIVGYPDAEHDRRVFADCFYDNGALTLLQDTAAQQSLVLARTGVGKSALLLELATNSRAISIDPHDLALEFISNSDILQFFAGLDINLDPFYKLLWRHCFVTELLRAHFKNESRFSAWIQQTFNKKHKEANDYLKRWGDSRFWEDTQLTHTIVAEKVGVELKNALGAKYANLELSASTVSTLEAEQRLEIKNCSKSVIGQAHSKELKGILALVNAVLTDRMQPYYIVIDGLDEDWVEDSLRYRLVMALIDTVREFRKTVDNAKIVIALREDLLLKVCNETHFAGYQEEKWKTNWLRLTWTRDELVRILDSRVNQVLCKHYKKKERVGAADVLTSSNLLDYMIERTLLRPRELIDFFNRAIAQAGPRPIAKKDLTAVEKEYSEERLRSIRHEWAELVPQLDRLARALLERRPEPELEVQHLCDESVHQACLSWVVGESESAKLPPGIREAVSDGKGRFTHFVSQAVIWLARAEVVSLLLRPGEGFLSGPVKMQDANPEQIDAQMRVRVHPTFLAALSIGAWSR